MSRRLLLAAPAGLLGALAACTPEPEPGEEFADLGSAPEEVSAGPHVTFEEIAGAEVLLLPGRSVQLVGSTPVESFTAGQLGEMTSRTKRDDTPFDHPVPAPEGSVFLVTALTAETTRSVSFAAPGTPQDGAEAGGDAGEAGESGSADDEGAAQGVELSSALIVRDAAGEPTRTEIGLGAALRGLLMQVPQDPSPEDAVLEVVVDGAVQRLSLVDGSLLHTDVPHAYERRREVAIRDDDATDASARVESRDGVEHTLMLSLHRAATAAHMEGRGWAPEGAQLLRIDVEVDQILPTAEEGSGQRYGLGELAVATLALPDGSAIEPFFLGYRDGDPGAPEELTSGGVAWQAWYEIPTDLGTAGLRLIAVLDERRDEAAPGPEDPDAVVIEAGLELG